MAASATGDAVYVEGRDDEHVIGHLLIRRGVDRRVFQNSWTPETGREFSTRSG